MIRSTVLAAALMGLVAAPAFAGDAKSGTVGSGGSAAAGSTSASTLGLGGTTVDEEGNTSSSIGTGGSAAAADGKTQTRSKVNDNKNMMMGHSKAQAMDKGTFSKSHTKTKIRKGEELQSTTRTMSHVPGEKPQKSTSSSDVNLD